MKFKNGRDIKAGDKVIGQDHFGREVTGIVVKAESGPRPFILQKPGHKAGTPSLNLASFLHADDAGGHEAVASQVSKPDAIPPKAS